MSVRIMSMVFENQILSSTQKLVMLALADHANDEGKSVYPSQSTVSRKTGLARGTVNRHIQELINDGYLWSKGYKSERSNVLELEIVVKRLAEGIGVTESDTPDMGVKNEGCNSKLQQVSPTVTTSVTHGDTNHQLTINKPSLKDINPLDNEPTYIKVGDEFKKSKINSHSKMVGMLAKVTKMDFNISMNAGRLNRASKQLRDVGYSIKDIERYGVLWKEDWRYKQDKKPPLLSILLTEIGQMKFPKDSAEDRKKKALVEIERAEK